MEEQNGQADQLLFRTQVFTVGVCQTESQVTFGPDTGDGRRESRIEADLKHFLTVVNFQCRLSSRGLVLRNSRASQLSSALFLLPTSSTAEVRCTVGKQSEVTVGTVHAC